MDLPTGARGLNRSLFSQELEGIQGVPKKGDPCLRAIEGTRIGLKTEVG